MKAIGTCDAAEFMYENPDTIETIWTIYMNC